MSASRKAAPPATTLTITELAQEFDITPRAIRFYEDVGLLKPGRQGRNRVYTHRPVTIHTATGIIRGEGLESDNRFENYRIIQPTGEIEVSDLEGTSSE